MHDENLTITGLFRPNTPDPEQDQILADIARLDGVEQTGRLDPSATVDPVRRMFYVTIPSDVDLEGIVRLVSALPSVESAAAAAQRVAADASAQTSACRGPGPGRQPNDDNR